MKKRILENKADYCFGILFLMVFLFRIGKAHYGIGSADEHFYITLPFRFLSGDAMLVDDWHIAQLIGFVQYPVAAVYKVLNPGLEGVVLHFRILYVCFTALVTLAIYHRFHPYGIRAAVGALIYFSFTPFHIMALSYNTMSVGFLILAYLVYPFETYERYRYLLSGFFYGLAVVNTPYLAIAYFIWCVLFFRKRGKQGIVGWLFESIGIALVVVLLSGFLFSRAGISEIVSVLPNMIDPSHSSGMLQLLVRNGGKLVLAYRTFFLFFIFEVCVLPYVLKHREFIRKYEWGCLFVNGLSMLYVSWIRPYYANMGGHALVLIPFLLNGILYGILHRDAEEKLWYGIGLSVIHALLILLSSNVGPRSFCPPLIFAAALLPMTLSRGEKKMMIWSVCFLCLLAVLGGTRVYLGSGNYEVRLENGPLEGLYDTNDCAENYEKHLNDLAKINDMEGGYVALITNRTWEYLAVTKPLSVNSTYLYFWDAESYTECLDRYYALHAERRPVYIYVDEGNQYGADMDQWTSKLKQIERLSCGNLYVLD